MPRASPFIAALLLSACTLIPHYDRPAAPVPAAWPQGPAYDKAGATPAVTAAVPAMATTGWEEFFKSAELRALIAKALVNNRDLRQSVLNIQVARDQYRLQHSQLFPFFDATGTFTKTHEPASLLGSETGGAGAGASTGVTTGLGSGITFSQAEAGLSVTNYELDLFGHVQSLTKEAFEQYLASQDARDAAQISLVAQVADTYLTLLADRAQLKLADDTLNAYQDTLKLTQARLSNGVGTDLDVSQAQQAVQTAAVNRIASIRQAAQDLNALSLLVGAPVSPDDVKTGFDEADAFAGDLPTGLPSDLLNNRPDIRQAEHQLKAQNADIGAARADFFPQVTLTGSVGFGSTSLSHLFDAHTGAWSFGPSIDLPIFHGGANVANLDLSKTEKNIAVARYEGTIQTAFREVADALAARGTLGDQLTAQQALADAAGRSFTLSKARYDTGIDSYLDVLDSQRALFSAQQGLIEQKLALLSNRVAMYQTLGGGLDVPAAAKTTAP